MMYTGLVIKALSARGHMKYPPDENRAAASKSRVFHVQSLQQKQLNALSITFQRANLDA